MGMYIIHYRYGYVMEPKRVSKKRFEILEIGIGYAFCEMKTKTA